MDLKGLDRLAQTPITLTLNARQFALLIEWLQVETLGRTEQRGLLEPEGQDHAQAAQRLRELDEVLATIRAAYQQAAQRLGIDLNG